MKIQDKKIKRHFVPEELNLDCWEDVDVFFGRLLNENLYSASSLEKWLSRINELKAVLHQEKTLRYIQMTCQTDDREKTLRYQYFIRETEPRYKVLFQKLNTKLLSNSFKNNLSQGKYGLYFRNIELGKRLFFEENLPLKAEENRLKMAYQHLTGRMTVRYAGQELTMQQASAYLKKASRTVRKKIWEIKSEKWLQHREQIENIFTEMIYLRTQMASQAGFPNYRDYIFQAYRRFDYGPEQCIAFHKICEDQIMPLLKKIQEKRKKKLGLLTLKPFDVYCDEDGLPSLQPFSNPDELIEKTRKVFSFIDSRFEAYFDRMMENNLLDVYSRKGKAPGAYCVKLQESGLPFIFMNATGSHQDVMRLLHEAGHAFHYLSTKRSPHLYGTAPKEMCELASLGMELMGLDHLHVFYSDGELRRAKRIYFQEIISYLPGIATIDAFQHWIYTHESHTPEERKDYWLELMDKYLGIVDYSDYKPLLEVMYHQVALLFEAPFYFVEYAFAYIGALQIWLNDQKDRKKCVDNYIYALSLGGSRPLKELYKAAGIDFGFNEKIIAELLETVEKEIFSPC